MARMVKHHFTLDTKNVYTVKDGVVSRRPIDGPLGVYADTGPNVGYLSNDNKYALRIRDDDIARISRDSFMELRKYGSIESCDMTGVIIITYDADVFTDAVLSVNTQYKMKDRIKAEDDGESQHNNETTRNLTASMVASTAMNMSVEDRDKIGMTNYRVQPAPAESTEGTHRRFGSGSITVGGIHRPQALPTSRPVVQEGSSAWYSANVFGAKYIKYQKPIGVKSKVCVDKRFPMYAVPMIIDDMLGFAHLMEIGVNIAATDYIPVSTPVEGTYWMFRRLENGKGITFYPDVLADVVSENSSIFPEIDLSGKIRIAVNNFGNLFSDDVEEVKKKSIMDIYANFFRLNPTFFHVMKIDWNTGFIIALSEESTPVLLMAAMLDDGYVEYPKYVTVIPISGSVGFAAIGLSASEVRNIERALGMIREDLPEDAIQ